MIIVNSYIIKKKLEYGNNRDYDIKSSSLTYLRFQRHISKNENYFDLIRNQGVNYFKKENSICISLNSVTMTKWKNPIKGSLCHHL